MRAPRPPLSATQVWSIRSIARWSNDADVRSAASAVRDMALMAIGPSLAPDAGDGWDVGDDGWRRTMHAPERTKLEPYC
jgi:hypothetical protein